MEFHEARKVDCTDIKSGRRIDNARGRGNVDTTAN